jgi:uncharacterized protein
LVHFLNENKVNGGAPMKKFINKQLEEIEKDHSVKIVFACEAGSRATGLATKTSDYDVRFLYIRPIHWYLSIDHNKSDVISLPINAQLDLHGWDLHKALFLLKKSNPTLLEWLHSAIIYSENEEISLKLKEVVLAMFSTKACLYHYLKMAKGNYHVISKSEETSAKLYLNVIRPLLSCLWLEKNHSFPSSDFEELMKISNSSVRMDIETLVCMKKGQRVAPNFMKLNTFIEKELIRLDNVAIHLQDHKHNDTTLLNEIFIFALRNVWKINL